jgi:hypothetical protein
MDDVKAYVGIDVAFAKKKRLPVAMCVWDNGRLLPLPLPKFVDLDPPRGKGNVAALDPKTVRNFADETAHYLRDVEKHFEVSICRIGIDAPSDPKSPGLARRISERALDADGIRCFPTPSKVEIASILQKVTMHLDAGGAESRLPHANQLWMLVGFALFERLRQDWECLEVFPQATIFGLGANRRHKSKKDGVALQLAAVAKRTLWPNPSLGESLKSVVRAPAHDGLDAYLSAWVAALGPENRACYGEPPNDAIWVPKKPVVS